MKESVRYALRVTWARPEGRIGLTILAIIVVAALLLPPMLQDPRAQPDILNGSLRPPTASHGHLRHVSPKSLLRHTGKRSLV